MDPVDPVNPVDPVDPVDPNKKKEDEQPSGMDQKTLILIIAIPVAVIVVGIIAYCIIKQRRLKRKLQEQEDTALLTSRI